MSKRSSVANDKRQQIGELRLGIRALLKKQRRNRNSTLECEIRKRFLRRARTQAIYRAYSSGRDEADFSGELAGNRNCVGAKAGEAAGREFDLFVARAKLEVVPVDAEQVEIARSAWRKYGKGRHAAGLNFGDCLA
jgi:hypothetical protein